MRAFLNDVRWLWLSRGFRRRYLNFVNTGIRRSGDRYRLLGAFLTSGGSRLTRALERSHGRTREEFFVSDFSMLGISPNSKEYSDTLAALKLNGYAILPWTLDVELIQELQQLFERAPLILVSDDTSVNGQVGNYEPLSPRAEKYDVDANYLIQNSQVVKLMLDRGILSLAQDYLGSTPIVDICAAWFSYPVKRSSNKAATQFHFDLDRTKWVKVFYFLSDVDEKTGAHLFVRGSHKDGAISKSLLRKGSSRLTDHEVEDHFPRADWTTIRGPSGTILLEDTRGIHKGAPLLQGQRLVLQFQYSVDLFGSETHIATLRPNLNEEPSFSTKHPVVLSGFHNENVKMDLDV